MAELPYHSDRVQVSAGQLTAWRGKQVGATVRLTGPCPACRHRMTAVVPLTTTSLEGFGAEPLSTLTVDFVCNCGTNHPGQPAAPPRGCGRTFSATALIDENSDVEVRPADDPHLVEAAEAFRLAQLGQLDRLRAAAEKWIAGITALFGLLAVVGLTLTADQIRKLGMPGRITVGIVVLLAVIAAAAAIVLAYRAAYGWPRRRSVADDVELLAWYADQRELSAVTAGRLRAAVLAAGLALGGLTAAGGLTWFLPQAPPAAPLVKVSTTEQATVCGTLLSSRADGTLRVRRADDGSVETLPLAAVARVATVGKC